MAKLYKGTKEVLSLSGGTQNVKALYAGDKLVWGEPLSPLPSFLREVKAVRNTNRDNGSYVLFDKLQEFSYLDELTAEIYPVQFLDYSQYVILSAIKGNFRGSRVFEIRTNTAYYPDIVMFNITVSDKAWFSSFKWDKPEHFTVRIKSPNWYYNDVEYSKFEGATPRTSDNIVLFYHGTTKSVCGIGRVTVRDHIDGTIKVELIPVYNSETSSYGFYDTVTKVFVGNSSTNPDYLVEVT